jgi:putative SbcD/Mre11-related phosphoesterase
LKTDSSEANPAALPALGPTRVLVDGDGAILDARLALYHRAEKWLAVADVHFGYELSQRAAGGLFPLWGMDSIERRLLALLEDYRPERLVIVGDFVHDRAGRPEALALLARLREGGGCEVTLIAGNHDRRAFERGEMSDCWTTERFLFHHGDGPAPEAATLGGRIAIIGHYHPAVTLRDGAGLSLKLPAFVQTADRWILPAFSPWAAGGGHGFGRGARTWLCSPKRILPPRP